MAKNSEDSEGDPTENSGGDGESASTGDSELIADAEREIAERIEKRLPPDRTVEPKELARVLARVVSVEIREAYSFQGPMPPPRMLREYEEALPGLAERIVARTEREQQFRHEATRFQMLLAKDGMAMEGRKALIGQVFAFIIAMTAIGGGICLLATGNSAGGLVPIIGALLALVAVFITGKVIESRQTADSGKKAETDNSETGREK